MNSTIIIMEKVFCSYLRLWQHWLVTLIKTLLYLFLSFPQMMKTVQSKTLSLPKRLKFKRAILWARAIVITQSNVLLQEVYLMLVELSMCLLKRLETLILCSKLQPRPKAGAVMPQTLKDSLSKQYKFRYRAVTKSKLSVQPFFQAHRLKSTSGKEL